MTSIGNHLFRDRANQSQNPPEPYPTIPLFLEQKIPSEVARQTAQLAAHRRKRNKRKADLRENIGCKKANFSIGKQEFCNKVF